MRYLTLFIVMLSPIRDQNGMVRIAEGESPDDAQLQTIDWLVEGVIERTQAGLHLGIASDKPRIKESRACGPPSVYFSYPATSSCPLTLG